MTVSIVALIVLLISILFIKSTIIIYGNNTRNTKVNVPVCIGACILAFVPFFQWLIMIGVPVLVAFWYGTDGFEDDGQRVKLSDNTFIGKILLFKI